MKFKRSLFIFRRDLRICDNTGLIEACRSSKTVIPCFIFDPRQTSQNPYFSANAFGFMVESLHDLARQFNAARGFLFVFQGYAEEVIDRLIDEYGFEAVFTNKDYTPFSNARDAAIQAACTKNGAIFRCCSDILLHEPSEIVKGDGTPYVVFSHFLRRAREIPIRPVNPATQSNFSQGLVPAERSHPLERVSYQRNEASYERGGRANALTVLADLRRFANYEREGEYPSTATTGLSAHNKFGTCSIREVYRAVADQLGVEHRLIVELFWRDFYSYVAHFFPHVFGHAFHRDFDSLAWNTDFELFDAWRRGLTGFPIVDAGMRQLNATGFMHNRVRMLVASFLTKDLHIDWRWGERHFAQKLVDYDPAVNNGNWQWCASTGCDAQPYFRIFNPWLQQKRYDPSCSYIKKWVPELRALSAERIHSLGAGTAKPPRGYPAPIVIHATESNRAKEMYRSVIKSGREGR